MGREVRGLNIRRPRKPKNQAEGKLYDLLAAKGLRASKRGWPDFAVYRGNELVGVVEVKPSKRRKLRADQQAILSALAEAGIKAYRWSPDGGFERARSQTDPQPHTHELSTNATQTVDS